MARQTTLKVYGSAAVLVALLASHARLEAQTLNERRLIDYDEVFRLKTRALAAIFKAAPELTSVPTPPVATVLGVVVMPLEDGVTTMAGWALPAKAAPVKVIV